MMIVVKSGLNRLKRSLEIRWKPLWQWLSLAGGLATSLIFFSAQALAWGPQGHRIVAEIAEQRLKPEVRQTIRDKFSIKHLVDVANWADQIKRKRSETRPWHYTNISAGEFLYNRQRDCPTGDCVTEKIKEFAGKLKSPKVIGRSRVEALMFLIHFVGDIHQPLHLGNAGDRGGNTIKIIVRGERTNLHAVWDHGLIQFDGQSLVKYATKLSGQITDEKVHAWITSDVIGWANESRQLAMQKGYPLELNKRGELSANYLAVGERIVMLQLQKAGVRLAHLLNQTIKS